MKRIAVLALVLAVCALQFVYTGDAPKSAESKSAESKSAESGSVGPKAAELETFAQRMSRFVGQNIANYIEREQQALDMTLDLQLIMRTVKDRLEQKAAPLPDDQMRAVYTEASKKKREVAKMIGEKNKKLGETFLAENGKKEGVITTKSGLQYKVLKQGSGAKPTRSDRVRVHYRGTLIDGTEFDSSHSRGSPAEFRVGGVIPGWTEALLLMSVGSKHQLFIPAQLAYRERGSPPKIGPNSTLVFEVELLEVIEPEAGPPMPPSRPPVRRR